MITPETLDRVAARAAELNLSEACLTHLRREWPDLHFTLCSEDDVPALLHPALEAAGFNIYLVSKASHCLSFTPELSSASGLVLATACAD